MSVQLIGDNDVIETKLITFSDGGINLKIDTVKVVDVEKYVCFTILPDTPVCQYELIIDLAEAIVGEHLSPSARCVLNLSYFPHARADRVFEKGMSNPLENFCARLSTCEVFDKVLVNDLHNSEAVNNFTCGDIKIVEASQSELLKTEIGRNKQLKGLTQDESLIICAPDKGAKDKIKDISMMLERNYIQLNKERDVSTGWIKSVTIDGDESVEGKDILIVDDICDGGMTFIKSAQTLKDLGAKSVSLYVTHGIFSKGLDVFNGVVDNLFCYQIVMNYVTRQQLVNFNKGEQYESISTNR